MRLRTAAPALAVLLALAASCKEERSASVADGGNVTFTDAASAGVPAPPPTVPPAPSVGFGAAAGQAKGGPSLRVRDEAAAEQSFASADASLQGRGVATAATQADPTRRAAPDMIIRTGQASVQVDSLETAVTQVRQLASSVGGVIANSSLQSGRNQVRSATLEIRVAAARFDDLVAGLTPFGKVETVSVSAEDVGEEFVDLSARVANARRLEARLIELLAARTGKLSDVLTVERELARVREEIERYEGRLRYLQARAAVSTLAVTVHEPLPILAGQPATNPIARAFVQAWRNFVGLLAAFIASLGVLVPLAALAGLGWMAWTRLRRPAPVPRTTTVEG